MGERELTLAQKVFLLELNKIGLASGAGISMEVVDAHAVELGLLGAVRIEKGSVSAVPSVPAVRNSGPPMRR